MRTKEIHLKGINKKENAVNDSEVGEVAVL